MIANIDAVHACTDITGFGLAGHASEMAAGSNVTIALDAKALPVIAGVLPLVGQNKSGGMNTNRDHFGRGVEFGPAASAELRDLVFDPQTSGGLLIAVDPAAADLVAVELKNRGIQACFVGLVEPRGANLLRIG